MNLSHSPKLRIATLCALYVSQGIPFGFVTITLVAFLKDQGAGVEEIGLITAMSSLPWAFKWAWGPVIDRFGFPAMGKRRPWILFAQTMMALTILLMIVIPDLKAQFTLLTAMVFLHNVFASLQDVSTDALAVDLLDEKQRGKANGLMYASSYAGTFIGGAGISVVLFSHGFRAALITQVIALFAIMMLPTLLRERPGEKILPWTRGSSQLKPEEKHSKSSKELLINLLLAFTLRSSICAAIFALLIRIPIGAMPAIFVNFMTEQLGWTPEGYAQINSYSVWFGFAGSVLGGFLADWIGAKRLAIIASFLAGSLWISFALLHAFWANRIFLSGFIFIDQFIFSTLLVSTFAISMGVAWPRVAATQFTAYMALQNLSNSIGGKLAGWFDRNWSISELYIIFGVFQIALILVILLIDVHETRRVLGDASPSTDQEPHEDPEELSRVIVT
jgi:PAT family beta-lactamase induction signal transducer AmpG